MAKEMSVELVLTGPHAGKTKVIRGMEFVKGVGRFSGTPEAVNGRITYMGRCYGAHPKGSAELAAAQRNDEDGLRNQDDSQTDLRRDSGELSHRPANGDGATVQQSGPATAPRANDGSGSGVDDAAAGDARILSERTGHEDAGLHEPAQQGSGSAPDPVDPNAEKTLEQHILELDPENDEAWTNDGRPSLMFLQTVTGNAKLSRGEVDAAGQGWSRKDAAELKGTFPL